MLCIAVWGVAIYSNTLMSPFVFDDCAYVQGNPVIKSTLNPVPIIELAPSRWIGFFTFAVNYYLGGENTFGYHLANMAIHIGAAIACFWLIILTLSTPRLKDQTSPDFKSTIALLSGLIFLSHPVQTESVTYIYQRVESLAGLFYLLSITLYVKFRIEGPSKLRSLSYIASLMSALLCAMTKEIAVTLPVSIILYETVFIANPIKAIKRSILRFAPFLFLLMLVPVLAQNSPIMTKNSLYESPTTLTYLITQARVVVTYLRLLVWPVEQNLDYDFPLFQSFSGPEVMWSTCLIITIMALGLILYKASSMITFGMLWFFVTLSPTSSIISLPDVIFEHRLYLPLVGFVFVLAGIIIVFRKHWRQLSMVMLIVILLFSAATYRRNIIWESSLTLWEDAVLKSPGKARPRVNLGMAYIRAGEFDRALAELAKALALKPDSAEAYENMGVAYSYKGDYEKAIASFENAIDFAANSVSVYNELAEAYMHSGKKDLAVRNFHKVLSLNPYYSSARNNLGLIMAERGFTRKAIQEFEKVLQFDPEHTEAAFNLACAYAVSGKTDRAVRQYQKLIELKPDFLEAYHNLGILYLNILQKPTEARRCFEKVLLFTKDPRKAAIIKKILFEIKEPNQKLSDY